MVSFLTKEATNTKKEKRDIQLNIRLTKSERETLEAIAEIAGTDVSRLARNALESLVTLYRPLLEAVERKKGGEESENQS